MKLISTNFKRFWTTIILIFTTYALGAEQENMTKHQYTHNGPETFQK